MIKLKVGEVIKAGMIINTTIYSPYREEKRGLMLVTKDVNAPKCAMILIGYCLIIIIC
jgi:hypothetical protein